MTMFGVIGIRVADWVKDLPRQGVEFTVEGCALKVREEAEEFSYDPSLEEAADVLIALLGTLTLMGHDFIDLAEAVEDKMEINEQRTWEKQPDGSYHHV